MKHKYLGILTSLTLIICLQAPLVWAQDEESAEGVSSTPIYIPLQPPFVVNYGGVGRLKYLKAELSVRVQNTDAAEAVRHHMPYIRNNLVLLFSRQTEDTLGTQEGKESLRQAALEQVREVVETEGGNTGVVDLYFENFVIQK